MAPSRQIRSTSQEDIPALRGLLSAALDTPSDRPFLRPDVLRWKYFESLPDWSGPRSFLVAEAGRILAHIALWPFTLLLPSGPLQTAQGVDWGRDPRAPGAGSAVRESTFPLVPVQVGIQGTPFSRRARERSGFLPWTELQRWATICRPWQHFRHECSHRPARAALRFLRELAAGAAGPAKAAPRWRFSMVERFSEEIDPVLPVHCSDRIGCAQSRGRLNYLLGCPCTRCHGLYLYRDDCLRGYAILNRTPGWVRIGTLHVHEGSPDDLAAAYRTAIAAALEDPAASGVLTDVSCPQRQAALRGAGFRLLCSYPATLLDPANRIDRTLPVDLQMTESDLYFLE